MKTLIIAALIVVACLTTVNARVGETEQQIDARYGKPVNDTAHTIVGRAKQYALNGYKIMVVFIDGISQAETIKKLSGAPFSSDEVKVLVANNGAGLRWIEMNSDGTRQEWWRDDQKVRVVHLRRDNVLEFSSPNYDRSVASAKRASAAEKLKNF